MDVFRRRPPDLATLLARRAQLVAELEAVEDGAWTAVWDHAEELAESRSLRRQTEGLHRALADLNRRIAAERDRLA